MKYCIDPKNDKQSVSLTLLIISFVLYVLFAITTILELTKGIGPLSELFYFSVALYFGRRVKIGSKNLQVDNSGEKL